MATTGTKRRQSAEERRAAVIQAARREFARRGLEGTTTEDIAKAAGISQPYLFRLFGSKKELYLAAAEQRSVVTRLALKLGKRSHNCPSSRDL